MIYEVRRYDAMPGQMPALQEVMADLAMPAFERAGMRVIGAWEPLVGAYTNEFTYMLAWEDLNEREEKWAAFFIDPEWQEGTSKLAAGGPLVSREFHYFLKPTSYSPLQ
jgi:hypothetical protein